MTNKRTDQPRDSWGRFTTRRDSFGRRIERSEDKPERDSFGRRPERSDNTETERDPHGRRVEPKAPTKRDPHGRRVEAES